MTFKNFLIESEQDDIKNTISSLPKSHQALLKGFKFDLQKGNSLKGDSGHVGEMDEKNKTITLSGGWNYSREYTLLHETAHLVWKYILNKDLRSKWGELTKKHKAQQKKDTKNAKDALEQNPEELFCMVYSTVYCKHKITTYSHPKWIEFIKNIP